MNGTVELVESVPEAFARVVADALRTPGPTGASLFLSGGSTAEECYRRLAAGAGPAGPAGPAGDAGSECAVDWSQVDVYLGDERCVPLDDPDSNHRMISEVLLGPIGPVRSDLPMYRSGSPEEAAAAYQRVIEPLDPFDLVHLGLGPDGHCASLFPDSAALGIDDPDTLVAANRDPYANNPHERITLTLPGIARARLVVFTVSGASKRKAFERIVAGDDLPGARVSAQQVLWLVDAAAAGDALLAG